MARIVSFEPAHCAGAAALVVASAAEARRRHPLLPAALEVAARVEGLLAGPAGSGLGVAALEGRRVAGFLVPLFFDLWGGPGAYVPEWGQAAADSSLVGGLYEAGATRWVGAGRTVHAVTLWAHEAAMEAAWHELGFGRAVVDAVRGLEPPGRRAPRVVVRRAGPGDATTLARLERALWEHLAAPPASRVHPGPAGRSEAARRLADPAQPVWVAEVDGAVAGFISLQPGDESPPTLRSPDLVRCDGAFVLPGRRGKGVGRSLLSAALGWARAGGFTACALDYESANPAAARFWPRCGFLPVLHSVARRIA